MRRFFAICGYLVAVTLQWGCATLYQTGDATQPAGTPTEAGEAAAAPQGKSVVLPFPEPVAPQTELDSELVYSTLLGEIATQRGRLDEAYAYQYQTAVLAGDAKAAERATRIAMLRKQTPQAAEAVQKWVELAPNDLSARQLAVILMLDTNQPDRALRQVEAIIAIGEAKGENGFVQSMAAVSKAKDRQAAKGVLQQVAGKHDDDPRAGYALAMLAFVWKDYALARSECGKLIERHPDWSESYVLLSRIYLAEDDKSRARSVLEDALRRMPEDLQLNLALARIMVETKAYADAYRQFTKLSRLQPEEAEYVFTQGVLALQLQEAKQAHEHFLRLETMGKRPKETAYYLGRIAEEQDRPDEAIERYKQVTGGEFQEDAQVRIARLLAANGELGEARQWLLTMRAREPEQSVRMYLIEIEVLREYGSPDQVLALYETALRTHPDNEDLLYSRGLYGVTIDRLDILESDLRQIIERNPNNADALNALGYTLADQTDRYQEALDLITRALKLKPDAPAILDSMGWVYYRLGDHQRALDYLRRAFERLQDPEIGAHLGELLWVTGARREAREVWQSVLDKDPESEPVRRTMQRLMK